MAFAPLYHGMTLAKVIVLYFKHQGCILTTGGKAGAVLSEYLVPLIRKRASTADACIFSLTKRCPQIVRSGESRRDSPGAT